MDLTQINFASATKYPLMDFEKAKLEFLEFTQAIHDDEDRNQFYEWMRDVVLPEFWQTPRIGHHPEEGDKMLEIIAGDIRSQMPQEAILKSETIVYPTVGEDASLNPSNSVHVDAFLYDEDGEEALVQEGLLCRNYCGDCGSRNIEEINIITHSCSKARLRNIFNMLPSLVGKTLIDIGSRIGAVLWGAYCYSHAAKIVGVEINADLCSLQRAVVEKFRLADRITVMEGDMCGLAETIKTGDVVILNNVFDWFMAPDLQVKMWQFLRATLSPGALLVTIPSLETSLEVLDTGIDLNTWVRPFPTANGGQVTSNDDMDFDEVETSEVSLYQILET